MRCFIAGIRALFCTVCLFPHTAVLAAPGDEHWDPQFGWPGVSNIVYGFTFHQNRLYVGGSADIGSVTNVSVNVWDGVRWSTVGNFFNPGNPTVWDLASAHGYLYAGGWFSHVDGVQVNGLARWDGNTWSALGFNGDVTTFAVNGNDLYVAGAFTNVAGIPATNIARFDGTSWHALGAGLGTNATYNYVHTILVTNGFVYAGGEFNNSGSVGMTNIARWDGVAWAPLGVGMNNRVLGLAVKGTDLYACGWFTMAGGTPAGRVARWDGATWHPLGVGIINNGVNTVGVLGDLVCFGGTFTNGGGVAAADFFAVWDGANWLAPAGGDLGSAALRIRSTGTNLYVGGAFIGVGGIVGNQIVTWNGTGWGSIGQAGKTNGLDFNVRAIARSGNSVYVGGIFSSVGQVPASRIARFDGTNWHALGTGVRGNSGAALAVNALAVRGSDLFVAGSFTNAGGIAISNIARWDGANWHAMGSGIPGTVFAVAALPNAVYVGGNFTNRIGASIMYHLAQWDGFTWSELPGGFFSGPGNETVNSLVVSPTGYLHVGGNFRAFTMFGMELRNIVMHTGSDWFPLDPAGAGVNSNVLSIAFVLNRVYVGGRFNLAGGVPVSRIACWDGAAWSNVGGGVGGAGNFSVSALATIGGNVYAGGNFTSAGGLAANRIAKWDGANWSVLGTGIQRHRGTPSVGALASVGNDLYVGGGFEHSGSKPAYYFARWNESRDFDFVPFIQFSKWARYPDSFRASVFASGVSKYVVEASTNLMVWEPLVTNTFMSVPFQDNAAPQHPLRFYRARQIP